MISCTYYRDSEEETPAAALVFLFSGYRLRLLWWDESVVVEARFLGPELRKLRVGLFLLF